MTATLSVAVPRDYWLSANRTITNHAYRRRLIDALHLIATTAARTQRLPAIETPTCVTWTIHYPKGVSAAASASNSLPTVKAILDSLVPRWLPDDDSLHVIRESFERGPNLTKPGGHLVVATFRQEGRI